MDVSDQFVIIDEIEGMNFRCFRIPMDNPKSYKYMLKQDIIFLVENDDVQVDDRCEICFDSLNELSDMGYLRDCKHRFHLHCLKTLYLSTAVIKCPYCKIVYNLQFGDCGYSYLFVKLCANNVGLEFNLVEYTLFIDLNNDDDGQCIKHLLIKAFQRQLLNQELLESFWDNDFSREFIEFKLRDLNVFPNELTNNLDDDCWDDELPNQI
ncbi:hypothetical protein HELRODRAFT_169067 [Helobdella robusta]|uniref:E3 ubiquitin-protein ligase n=1 Tax=Helobdella robusta TaxID=6412 RepID=T1F1C8_HELRO|nr:hypothetical protein HELRODRAFT_169067 [Helobdella robusta]ESO09126.1 hypothetical protein HELRODRAFT_169067 [Helobdella robusta]